MDNNPFSQAASSAESLSSRRRSTRVDYVTTVLLSGKDASGAPFREFTQTSTVNLHGCRLRTSYRIMVGMLVSLECPQTGAAGKGVCVRVWEAPPGVGGHEIAVQLIKPQNLWGITNPPADWEAVAKTVVQGRKVQAEHPGRPATVTAPAASSRSTAIPPAWATGAPSVVATPRPAPAAGAASELRIAELERRSTQLMESVLNNLRSQAEEIARNSLEEFRQQVEALIADSQARLRQELQQSREDSAASLTSLRSDLLEQLSSRGAEVISSTEAALRARLDNHAPAGDETPAVKPPDAAEGE